MPLLNAVSCMSHPRIGPWIIQCSRCSRCKELASSCLPWSHTCKSILLLVPYDLLTSSYWHSFRGVDMQPISCSCGDMKDIEEWGSQYLCIENRWLLAEVLWLDSQKGVEIHVLTVTCEWYRTKKVPWSGELGLLTLLRLLPTDIQLVFNLERRIRRISPLYSPQIRRTSRSAFG